MKYDVVIHDTVSRPYDLTTAVGIGGSERAAQRLARALGEKYSVLLHRGGEVECKALIVMRYSPFPVDVTCDTAVRWVHDLSGAQVSRRGGLQVIALSDYQARKYRGCGFDVSVIPGAIPDIFYTLPRPSRVPGQYLYAAAKWKGWERTYAHWKDLRQPGDKLYVMDCSYDQVPVPASDPSVVSLQNLSDARLFTLLCQSSLFYVNTGAECWSALLAMADAVGTPMHILSASDNDLTQTFPRMVTRHADEFEDAFRNRRDHRMSTVLPMWEKALGLT
jgi:hypothetical protein